MKNPLVNGLAHIHVHLYTCEKQTLVCLDSKQVEWPHPIWSVLRVGSLKRPKHAVHEE